MSTLCSRFPPAGLRRLAAAAAMPLLLSACGGGGADEAGNTNNYNLDSAISRVLQNGLPATTLTGSLSGVTFTLTQSYTPLADGLFEGAQRHSVRETTTISGGGVSQTTVSTMFFSVGPFVDRGSLEEDGERSVNTATGSLPTNARVGDSGPLHTGVSYTDASKQTVLANSTTTWSLDPDTSTTALACLRAVIHQVGSATPVTGSQCWRIDTAGNVLGSVFSIDVNGSILQFR